MATVLHVVQSGDRGGVQRHIRDLALGLRDETGGVIAGSEGWLTHSLEAEGVTVLPAPHLRRSVVPGEALAARRDVREGWRRSRADVVHAHGVLALWACLPLAGEVPLIYTGHGFQWHDASHPAWVRALSHRLHRAAAPRVAAFVALGEEQEEAGRIGFRRIVRIPHGVACECAHAHGGAEMAIGTAARLVAGKGIEDLLPILRQLPGVTLRIAGDGPLRPGLEDAALREGVRGRVEFLGWQEDLSVFYRSIGVYVSLSRKEGLPYGVLDALAQGVPVVLSDIPGHRELVRDGQSGFLVAPDDAPAAADAIWQLLRNGDLRRAAEETSRQVAGEYGLAAMLARYRALYKEVAGA